MLTKIETKEVLKETIEEIFFGDDEFSVFNSLNDRISELMKVNRTEERMQNALALCDKFEDYMKNIDKLNMMINEFKGLVAMVRGEMRVAESFHKDYRRKLKELLKIMAE